MKFRASVLGRRVQEDPALDLLEEVIVEHLMSLAWELHVHLP